VEVPEEVVERIVNKISEELKISKEIVRGVAKIIVKTEVWRFPIICAFARARCIASIRLLVKLRWCTIAALCEELPLLPPTE